MCLLVKLTPVARYHNPCWVLAELNELIPAYQCSVGSTSSYNGCWKIRGILYVQVTVIPGHGTGNMVVRAE
jgi:hypothetical protein